MATPCCDDAHVLINNGTRQCACKVLGLACCCREEEFSIKMVTSDDDKTVDVVVQGDEEEITRMTKELALKEKGMVYVPGILEQAQK